MSFFQLQEENTKQSTDATSRRINSLRAVIISMLYDHHGLSIKERHLKDNCSDIQLNEIKACLLISNLLMSYIPEKKNYHSIPYQIPFVLMANRVLHCTGYATFMTHLSPLAKYSQNNMLKIDTSSLFTFFCSGKKDRLLDIYDYDDKIIISAQIATECRDTVLGSFFKLDAIKKCTGSYGLEFEDYIYVLPGGKVARMTRTKRCLHPKNTCPVIQKEKPKKKALAKTKTTEKKENLPTAVLKAEIDALERKLKDLYKQIKKFLFAVNMKEIRKSWRKSFEKNEMYTDFNCLKAEANAYLYNIQKVEGTLARARQTHYRLLRPEKSTDDGIGSLRITITNEEYKCIENVENIRLDNSVNPNNLVYSGTDNGLKTAAIRFPPW
ncbi:hypothetical protein K501DRAFT_269092 [Backusella circina FSU 941]|nr:hypothetical protein K501DRAFT_269092 [Backusella circina FSU 941]